MDVLIKKKGHKYFNQVISNLKYFSAMTNRSFRSSEIQFNNLPLVSNLQPVCLPAGLEAQPFDLLIPSKYKIEFSLGRTKGSLDLVGLLEDIALKRYGNLKKKFNCQKFIFKIKNLKCE